MNKLFLLFIGILAVSLLLQWSRGFMPTALRSRVNAGLSAFFHAPGVFLNAFQPGTIVLANVKADLPPGIKVKTRNPQQQAAFVQRLRAIENNRMAPADDNQSLNVIMAANASRFNESFMVQDLTDYAVGWRDPNNIEMTVDFFAPRVQVSGPYFEYLEAINAEEFYSDGAKEDLRAIGAEYPVIKPPTGANTLGKTEDRGLTQIVDLRTVRGRANWEQNTVAKIMRRLHRNRLRRAVALISAAATNTGKTWDSSAGKDPDMDLISEGVLARTASGVGFNRIGFGDTAWAKRALSHRAQDTAGGFASASMTPEQLAGLLAVDQIMVSRERYQTSAAGKSEIVNNLVLMFMALANADAEDGSNIKTFIAPYEGGGFFRVYVQQISANLVAVTVSYEELQKITSTLGIRQFTIS